jgi:acetyltransferase
MHHDLRPLLRPDSVALVGASERPASVGRVVFENLLAGGFAGPLYAVNARRSEVLGQRAFPSLRDIGAPVDLAIIAAPPDAVVDVLDSAGAAGVDVAVVLRSPGTVGTRTAHAWSNDVAAAAKRNRVRVVGPGALGVIRPDIGLNATFCTPRAIPGRLALIAQSGAVATAVLDFATPLGIGFSTVISLGGGIDVAFGELLDLMLLDSLTDGILLYVEDVGDARGFVSALRAAARTKPVVVLKAGRSLDAESEISPDAVFDAALRRSGTVRVSTYTQFFAAARILARRRLPQGTRVAIVSNGRGPGVLAADVAADRGLQMATLTGATSAKLDQLLDGSSRAHAIDVGIDAPADRLATVVQAVLDDANVDAVIALHVPRPCIPPLDAATALAAVSAHASKPVLAAWMGAVDRQEVHDALESGNVSNFFTPENAVDALSFLVSYRINQEWLLEVPAPQPEPEPFDVAPLEVLRLALLDSNRTEPRPDELATVLRAFGIDVSERTLPGPGSALAIGVDTDRQFGPVIWIGRRAESPSVAHGRALMLPPLNARLAADAIAAAFDREAERLSAVAVEALIDVLTRTSALVCALPWVTRLDIEPVVDGSRAHVARARMTVDPRRKLLRGYPHMAIHPYPVELIGDVTLADGTPLHVRPIRPEDAALERAFVNGLSEQTRYYRFFYRLSALTPAMLARFTQVDYDRELALVALAPSPDASPQAFVGVARYIGNPDHRSAEFAVVIADAWQRKGIAKVLMRGLIVCAKRRGFEQLVGTILRANDPMQAFVRSLGFSVEDDPEDTSLVVATLALN